MVLGTTCSLIVLAALALLQEIEREARHEWGKFLSHGDVYDNSHDDEQYLQDYGADGNGA
jgi:hypothetical protein